MTGPIDEEMPFAIRFSKRVNDKVRYYTDTSYNGTFQYTESMALARVYKGLTAAKNAANTMNLAMRREAFWVIMIDDATICQDVIEAAKRLKRI